ncbi:unnamed protein product [Brachionus calyciflorus]|uniref:Uncharacterized protein n=1 Tax=Brachionus calyciflorus TaxID=104777 RepID=A0A814KMP0_9BILA|nr:unnamed protein product [Brachionus calyciflorus]
MFRKIYGVVKEVSLSSTSHGLPNIIRSETVSIRLMWIIFTIISTGLCAFMIVESIMNYLSYETTSKIRVLSESTYPFPVITACNANYLTTEYASEFLKNITFNSSSALLDYTFYNKAKSSLLMNQDLRMNISKFGDSYEKLILKCFLTFVNCKNENYWKYYYHPYFGNCYLLNSNLSNVLQVSGTGWDNGLNLILNLSLADGIEEYYPNSGAIILVHNQTMSPLSVNGFTISIGTETNVALSRQFKSLEPKPYSNCDGNTSDPNAFDSKLFKLMHSNLLGYDQNYALICVFKN